MKISFFIIPFFLFHCLSSSISAQQATLRITEQELPDFLYPLGDMVFADDTCIALPANGGLFNLHTAAWQVMPDTADLLLSYVTIPGRQDVLFTVYHKYLVKTCLYWRHHNNRETRIERLATLPGGLFRLLQKDNALFLFGRDEEAFHIYEYAADTLTNLYTSSIYIPSDIQVLNRSTLLLSVGASIVSLNRTGGLKEFCNPGSPVISFSIKNGQQLYVVTGKGLCVFEAGKLSLLAAGVSGRVFIEKERLYVLDTDKRKLYECRL